MPELNSHCLIFVGWWLIVSTIAAITLLRQMREQTQRDLVLAAQNPSRLRRAKLVILLALYLIGPPLIMLSLGALAWRWNRARQPRLSRAARRVKTTH